MVQRNITYMKNVSSKASVTLLKGDVVQGITLSSVSKKLRGNLDAAQRRARRQDHLIRLIFFKALGVVRYADAVSDLVPTRKPLTVSVERQ